MSSCIEPEPKPAPAPVFSGPIPTIASDMFSKDSMYGCGIKPLENW